MIDQATLQIRYLKAKQKLLKAEAKFSQRKTADVDALLQVARAELEQAFERWFDAEGDDQSNWSDGFIKEIVARMYADILWSALKKWNTETGQGLDDQSLEAVGVAAVPKLFPKA